MNAWADKIKRTAENKDDRLLAVAAYIREHDGCTQAEIAKALNIPATPLGRYCQAIVDVLGWATVKQVGRANQYYGTEDLPKEYARREVEQRPRQRRRTVPPKSVQRLRLGGRYLTQDEYDAMPFVLLGESHTPVVRIYLDDPQWDELHYFEAIARDEHGNYARTNSHAIDIFRPDLRCDLQTWREFTRRQWAMAMALPLARINQDA